MRSDWLRVIKEGSSFPTHENNPVFYDKANSWVRLLSRKPEVMSSSKRPRLCTEYYRKSKKCSSNLRGCSLSKKGLFLTIGFEIDGVCLAWHILTAGFLNSFYHVQPCSLFRFEERDRPRRKCSTGRTSMDEKCCRLQSEEVGENYRTCVFWIYRLTIYFFLTSLFYGQVGVIWL